MPLEGMEARRGCQDLWLTTSGAKNGAVQSTSRSGAGNVDPLWLCGGCTIVYTPEGGKYYKSKGDTFSKNRRVSNPTSDI